MEKKTKTFLSQLEKIPVFVKYLEDSCFTWYPVNGVYFCQIVYFLFYLLF